MNEIEARAVAEILGSTGFHLQSPHEFDAAFVRRGLFTTLVFLVKDLGGAPVDPRDIDALIKQARTWCKQHVMATWFFYEAGLNLVLLHEGQLARGMIAGVTDLTGTHGAILQSVTAVDRTQGSVAQETAWIVIGRVRLALRRLAQLRFDKPGAPEALACTAYGDHMSVRFQPDYPVIRICFESHLGPDPTTNTSDESAIARESLYDEFLDLLSQGHRRFLIEIQHRWVNSVFIGLLVRMWVAGDRSKAHVAMYSKDKRVQGIFRAVRTKLPFFSSEDEALCFLFCEERRRQWQEARV